MAELLNGAVPRREVAGLRLDVAVRAGVWAGLVILFLDFLVLAGWAWNLPALKSVVPGLATMKANTALGFMGAGAALALAGAFPSFATGRWVLGAVPLALGAASALEYLTGLDFGIDQVLFADPDSAVWPGRMSVATATNMMLMGGALLLLDRQGGTGQAVGELLKLVGVLHALLAVVGYAYNVRSLYAVGPYSSIALHTALMFLAGFAALYAVRPTRGIARPVMADTAGGMMARRLLLAALLVPFAIGLMVVRGIEAYAYDQAFGIAVFTIANIFVLGAVILHTAQHVSRFDQARQQALDQALEANRRANEALTENATLLKQIRQNEERFRTIVEASPMPIVISRIPDGSLIYANEMVQKMFGISRDAVPSLRVPDFYVNPVDREDLLAALTRDGQVRSRELHMKRVDGSPVWVSVNAAVTRILGEPAVIAGFVDVTERKRSEAELRASEERLRTILDNAPLAIVMSRMRDATLVYGNPRLAEMFRVPFGELSRRHPTEFFVNAKDREAYLAALARDGQVRGRELNMKRADGTPFWVSVNAAVVDFKGEPTLIAGLVDITRHREAQEQLAQAQKMEAVGQLTGGIAHDFNNLLTVVLGNLDLVRPQIADAGAARGIDSAMRAAERGAELTRRLLAFSRRQALNPVALDLNQLVDGLIELMRRSLGEHVEIITRLAPGAWPVLVDGAQLESALLNLCVNARDAMPKGGTLTIETGNERLDEDYARRHAEVAVGDYVMLAVSDTGVGMPPEVVEHAFEPFFTTKEAGKGSGLGLSMVYGFVKQTGGHVKIYSEVGQGTTIKLYLPRAAGAAVRAEPLADAAAATGGNETILVAEDDADVRAFVAGVLGRLGYRVIEAADGPAAERLAVSSPPIDLVLTDMVLPGGMTGRDIAAVVRRHWPRAKVLYTSGYTHDAVVHHGKLEEGAQLLSKPYTRDVLARMVRQALDRTDS